MQESDIFSDEKCMKEIKAQVFALCHNNLSWAITTSQGSLLTRKTQLRQSFPIKIYTWITICIKLSLNQCLRDFMRFYSGSNIDKVLW